MAANNLKPLKMNLSALEEDSDFDWTHDSNSSSDEEPPGVEQQFSVEPKTKEPLIPIQMVKARRPDQFIVKICEVSMARHIGMELRSHFFENCNDDSAAEWTAKQLKKNMAVIVETLFATDVEKGCEDERDDDNELDDEFLRGTVLSRTNEFYEVFLTDVGQIRKVNALGVRPMVDEKLLTVPRTYAIVTIPGLAPRKRFDNIPGLSQMNCRATDWSKEAWTDVNAWISKHKLILCRKLKEETHGVWFGDLYASTSEDSEISSSLSKFLIEQKHAFMDFSMLSHINNED